MKWLMIPISWAALFVSVTPDDALALHSHPQYMQIDLDTQATNQAVSIYDLTQQALTNCLEGQFEKALNIFNFVANITCEKDETVFSVALWGKTICDAYLANWESMFLDIEILESLIDACCANCLEDKIQTIPTTYPTFFNSSLNEPISSRYGCIKLTNNTGFANPDEVLTSSECCKRIRLFTEKLREMISSKFKNKPFTYENANALDKLWTFIGKVARKGEDCCCKETHWTICCGPINQIWREWQKNGVPDRAPDAD